MNWDTTLALLLKHGEAATAPDEHTPSLSPSTTVSGASDDHQAHTTALLSPVRKLGTTQTKRKHTFGDLSWVKRQHIHVVACNQKCDLDSIVATLLFAKAMQDNWFEAHLNDDVPDTRHAIRTLVIPYLPISKSDFLARPEIQYLNKEWVAEFVFQDTCPEWFSYSETQSTEMDAFFAQTIKLSQPLPRSKVAAASSTMQSSHSRDRDGDSDGDKKAFDTVTHTDIVDRRCPCPCRPRLRDRPFPLATQMSMSLVGHQHAYFPSCVPIWAVVDNCKSYGKAYRDMETMYETARGSSDASVSLSTSVPQQFRYNPHTRTAFRPRIECQDKHSPHLHTPTTSTATTSTVAVSEIDRVAPPACLVRLVLKLLEEFPTRTADASPMQVFGSPLSQSVPQTPATGVHSVGVHTLPFSPGARIDSSLANASHEVSIIRRFATRYGCANLCLAVLMQHTHAFDPLHTTPHDVHLLRELSPCVTPLRWLANMERFFYTELNEYVHNAWVQSSSVAAAITSYRSVLSLQHAVTLYTTTLSSVDRTLRVRLAYFPLGTNDASRRYENLWDSISRLVHSHVEIHVTLTQFITTYLRKTSADKATLTLVPTSRSRHVLVTTNLDKHHVALKGFLEFLVMQCSMTEAHSAPVVSATTDCKSVRVCQYRLVQCEQSEGKQPWHDHLEWKIRRWLIKNYSGNECYTAPRGVSSTASEITAATAAAAATVAVAATSSSSAVQSPEGWQQPRLADLSKGATSTQSFECMRFTRTNVIGADSLSDSTTLPRQEPPTLSMVQLV